MAVFFHNFVAATLLQNDESENDQVDVQDARADPEHPSFLAAEWALLDEIQGVAGDLLTSIALCEL